MSQPASACTSACRHSISTVSSLSNAAVAYHAVMPGGAEGIERDVADHADIRMRRLDRPDRPADQVVGIERLARVGGLQLLGDRREYGDGGDAELLRRADRIDQQVDREPLDAGHRGDRLAARLALDDEHRPDQVIDAEAMLGHQPARPGALPVAPQSGARVTADARAARLARRVHHAGVPAPATGRRGCRRCARCRSTAAHSRRTRRSPADPPPRAASGWSSPDGSPASAHRRYWRRGRTA